MRIKLRGASDFEKEYAIDVVNFCCSLLMSKRLQENLDITVKFIPFAAKVVRLRSFNCLLVDCCCCCSPASFARAFCRQIGYSRITFTLD